MGVLGITTFLQERDLLPSRPECCSTELWNDWKSSMSFKFEGKTPPPRVIPPNSTLLIDGNGLAFFLHRIAYARHVRSLSANKNASVCPRVQSLSVTDITKCLPSMMPLGLLGKITKEYINGLKKSQIHVQIYWDGPCRRFKARTQEKRLLDRQQDWAHLRSFCDHGTLPMKPTDRACECFNHFPLSGLFLKCVRHALQSCKVKMIHCSEEADIELARRASNDPTAFVLAADSDFLFFKGIQYIPFDALYVPSTPKLPLWASWLTRSEVAKALGLQDDQMVELAMLLGNDYVERESLQVPSSTRRPDGAIEWLREQSSEYQVQSRNSNAPEIDFVRALYNLEDLDSFPKDENILSSFENEMEEGINEYISIPKFELADNQLRGRFENFVQFNLGKYAKDPKSVDDRGRVLTKEHLSAYKRSVRTKSMIANTNSKPPSWSDVRATYIIETCIRSALSAVKAEKVVPSVLVHHLNFLAILEEKNSQNATDEKEGEQGLSSSELDNPFRTYNPILEEESNGYSNGETNEMNNKETSTTNRVESEETNGSTIVDKNSAVKQGAIGGADRKYYSTSYKGRGKFEAQKEEDKTNTPEPRTQPKSVVRPRLPIDDHEVEIMNSICNNRITIIHGETGCGKSSRVPAMILNAPSPEPSLPTVKMFISQPRRIAAASLVQRVRSCEPEHGHKFAIRMGNGYHEFETRETQAWFVTTGYLTRLLAGSPKTFNSYTHIVIDEVHERSVDTDVLCLLCRRLLHKNEKIRLVLMSATLATKLYQDYFDVPSDPIHVGARRFPIEEYFVENLDQFNLLPKDKAAVNKIITECETKKCTSVPASTGMALRCSLAARLATVVGTPGSSVLIFVPGMGEILSVMESIEKIFRPGVTFVCFPIHSDVPFEEQMSVFNDPNENEVRIIVATNAAESSVTLPAVDHVICMGLCRQVVYNKRSHRQLLTSAWISRASAKQRAGRTGRLRPGSVIRLYTRGMYEQYMDEFESGEMARIPLDSVIITLKDMLDEEVTPVLLDCIEPPPIDTIDRSFESLHQWHFLTTASDQSQITTLGKFASDIGIDLRFGSLLGLGIQFGVAAEAIELAAALSFPRSPFQMSSPLFHQPEQYNTTTSATYVSKCHFDAGLFSEPLGLMNALWDYDAAKSKRQFCTHYRFAHTRMGQLCAARNHLRSRVATFLGINEDRLRMERPPVHMPQSKLTILRLLQVWTFSETMIECPPQDIERLGDGSVSLSLTCATPSISEDLFEGILNNERHPYSLREEIRQKGQFEFSGEFYLADTIGEMEQRLVSYMCEMGIDCACFSDGVRTYLYLILDNETHHVKVINEFLRSLPEHSELRTLLARYDPNIKRRGIQERHCGLWSIVKHDATTIPTKGVRRKDVRRVELRRGWSKGKQALGVLAKLDSILMCDFEVDKPKAVKKKKTKKKSKILDEIGSKPYHGFQLRVLGKGHPFTKQDLQDLFGSKVTIEPSPKSKEKQMHFPSVGTLPKLYEKGGHESMVTVVTSENSSWKHPLLDNIPEGARMLSVIASGQWKRGHCLRIPRKGENLDTVVEVHLKTGESNIAKRWRQMLDGGTVLVQHDTVPASAVSSEFFLFATCAHMLELKGGTIKVECMTMLPPNPMWLVLAFASFGLDSVLTRGNPVGGGGHEDVKVSFLLKWVKDKIEARPPGKGERNLPLSLDDEEYASKKIRRALEFNKTSVWMGERLECDPRLVEKLCKLFSGLDGVKLTVWDTLWQTCLSRQNQARWRRSGT